VEFSKKMKVGIVNYQDHETLQDKKRLGKGNYGKKIKSALEKKKKKKKTSQS